jgi:hypothetical protein
VSGRLRGALLAAAVAGLLTGAVGTVPAAWSGVGVAASFRSSQAGQVAAVPAPLRGDVLAAAARFGLPPALLAAVAAVESSFRPDAVGPACPGGPALGLMQFLPSSWVVFNQVPGATPFQPGPALLAAGAHLLASGTLAGGGWSATAALFGYNHSTSYVADVLAVAAADGWTAATTAPDLDPARRARPLATGGAVRYPGPGQAVLAAAVGEPVLAVGPGLVLAVDPTGVRLRLEDGWVATESGLVALPGLRAGSPTVPGQPLGLATGPVRLTLARAGAAAPDLARYLARWPARAS